MCVMDNVNSSVNILSVKFQQKISSECLLMENSLETFNATGMGLNFKLSLIVLHSPLVEHLQGDQLMTKGAK